MKKKENPQNQSPFSTIILRFHKILLLFFCVFFIFFPHRVRKEEEMLFGLVVLMLIALANGYSYEKMLLTDVKTLTFRRGEMTNGKRSQVPQLACTKGDARYYMSQTPDVVQCTNMGTDDKMEIQWKCGAEMDDKFRFGSIEVNCEGHSHPEDPYITKGSCGLEYEFTFTEKGREWSRNKVNDNYHHHTEDPSIASFFLWMFAFALFMGLTYGIYKILQEFFYEDDHNHNHGSTHHHHYHSSPWWGSGWLYSPNRINYVNTTITNPQSSSSRTAAGFGGTRKR